MKQKYRLPLIFPPEMQKWLKRQELKGTSVPLLSAMGEQVTVQFTLHRNLCFLLYQWPLHAQHVMPAPAGFRETHCLPQTKQCQGKYWVTSSFHPLGQSRPTAVVAELPEWAVHPMSWMAMACHSKLCGPYSQGKHQNAPDGQRI